MYEKGHEKTELRPRSNSRPMLYHGVLVMWAIDPGHDSLLSLSYMQPWVGCIAVTTSENTENREAVTIHLGLRAHAPASRLHAERTTIKPFKLQGTSPKWSQPCSPPVAVHRQWETKECDR